MPLLTFVGGPQDGVTHKVPGQPPSVRHWASPGDRTIVGWVQLHRYTFRQCVARGRYAYEYTGTTDVPGPRPARAVPGGAVLDGWE